MRFPSLFLTASLFPAILTPAAIKTGPGIGAQLPNFSAPAQDGSPRTLQSLLGPKGAVLVLYRSADW